MFLCVLSINVWHSLINNLQKVLSWQVHVYWNWNTIIVHWAHWWQSNCIFCKFLLLLLFQPLSLVWQVNSINIFLLTSLLYKGVTLNSNHSFALNYILCLAIQERIPWDYMKQFRLIIIYAATRGIVCWMLTYDLCCEWISVLSVTYRIMLLASDYFQLIHITPLTIWYLHLRHYNQIPSFVLYTM